MQSSEETIPTARKERIPYHLAKKLGRQDARRMRTMVVESSSCIPLGGHLVEPGKRCKITVLEDEVQGILDMRELDQSLIEKAKVSCEKDILKRLDEEKVPLGSALEAERRAIFPDTWQAKFTKQNDRSPNCIVFAEVVGEPFFGHPDDLHEDKDSQSSDERIAAIVAKAIQMSQKSAIEEAVRKQVEEILTTPQAEATTKRKG